MKVKRYDTILSNMKCKVVDYDIPVTKDSRYIVDDSSFCPVSEAIKNLKDKNVSAQEIAVYYDFPNGKDDGSEVPINRRHDVKDITELSSAIMEKVEEITDRKQQLTEKLNHQIDLQNKLNAISAPTNESSKTQ